MKYTENLNLALYEKSDTFDITGDSDSLNNNAKLLDSKIADMVEESSEIKTNLNDHAVCNNLMGMEYGKYYHLDTPIPAGTKLYITKSDGTIFPTDNKARLYMYNENKEYKGYCELTTGVASKTTAPMTADIYYLRWYDSDGTGDYSTPMMVTTTDHKDLAYEEYFENVRQVSERLKNDYKITFVHNGGLCIIISGKANIIIDFGMQKSCEEILAVCKSNHITHFDYAFITHYHLDHVTADFATALTTMLNAGITFGQFVLPHSTIDWTAFVGDGRDMRSATNELVVNALTDQGISMIYPSESQTLTINNDISCACLNVDGFPDEYYTDTRSELRGGVTGNTCYNTFSAIYKFRINDFAFLVNGDISQLAQEKYSRKIGYCDIVQIEHHALNRWCYKEYMNNTRPKIAVFSQYTTDSSDSSYKSTNYLASYLGLIEYQKTAVVYSNMTGNFTIDIGDEIIPHGSPLPYMDFDEESAINVTTYETDKTVNGVKFVVNRDGTVTANGTATGNAYFYALQRFRVDKSTDVVFGGCPDEGTDTTHRFFVGIHNTDTSWDTVKAEYGEGAITTLEPDNEYLAGFKVSTGATVTDLTFKPWMTAITDNVSGFFKGIDYRLKKLEEAILTTETESAEQ